MESKNKPEYQPAPKTWENALVLSWLFGVFGVDRFYLGKIGTGVLKLVTFGGLMIWYLIDLLRTSNGTVKDSLGRDLVGKDDPHVLVRTIVSIYVVLQLITIVIFVIVSALTIHSTANFIKYSTEASNEYGSRDPSLLNNINSDLFGPRKENKFDESVFSLILGSDDCGVIRTKLEDESGYRSLTWVIADLEGFSVLERAAHGETHYRYFKPGTYNVHLKAFGLDGYAPASNTVTITCS